MRVLPKQQELNETKAPAPATRVQQEITPPLSNLQERSTNPLRVRFHNQPTHKYNLRSRVSLPWNQQHGYRHEALQFLSAQSIFQPTLNNIYQPDGKKETIDTLLQGSNRDIWKRSLSNEWGRLAQGNDNRVVATDTINFITQRSRVSQTPSCQRGSSSRSRHCD